MPVSICILRGFLAWACNDMGFRLPSHYIFDIMHTSDGRHPDHKQFTINSIFINQPKRYMGCFAKVVRRACCRDMRHNFACSHDSVIAYYI